MTQPRPRAFYFGDPAPSLAGWIHEPAGAASSLGVVMCPALFDEAASTDRTMRCVSEAIACRGIPVLRFDYAGTRDSAEMEIDDDPVSTWVDNVRCAIQTLKEVAGVDRVCVLGLRCGAALAALAAAGRTDVPALVAVAPVVRGRTYLRELRAFAARSAGVRTHGAGNADQAGSFALPANTCAAIGAIDLLAIDRAIAARVLLLDRDDLPSDDAWPRHLRRQGTTVDVRRVSGFADMMLDPHLSVMPAGMVRTLADWLAAELESGPALGPRRAASLHERCATLATSMHLPARGHRHGAGARETARTIDAAGTLFGIVTEPLEPAMRAPGVRSSAIILINAGAAPHVGPGRVYVSLARAWAQAGHMALRMDLSGLGESPARPGSDENVVYSPRAREDIAAAVAFVRRENPGARCYIAGICSGAYHGFKAAVGGVQVDGVIAINPLTFFWRDGMTFDAGPAQVIKAASRQRAAGHDLAAWRRVLVNRHLLAEALGVTWQRAVALGASRLREIARWAHLPLPNDLAAELKHVVRRRIDLLFVFSAGDPGHQLLLELGGSAVASLARRGALRVAVIDGADHVFTSQSSKDRLIAVLTDALAPRAVAASAAAAPAAWRLHDQSPTGRA